MAAEIKLTYVPVPIKAVDTIKKIYFEAPDYHIKKDKKNGF